MSLSVNFNDYDMIDAYYEVLGSNYSTSKNAAQAIRGIQSNATLLSDAKSDMKRAQERIANYVYDYDEEKAMERAQSQMQAFVDGLRQYAAALNSDRGQFYEQEDYDDFASYLTYAQTWFPGEFDDLYVSEFVSYNTRQSQDSSNQDYEVEVPGKGTITYTGAEIEAMISAESQPSLHAIQAYYGDDAVGTEAYNEAISAWREGRTVNLIEYTDSETGNIIMADENAADYGDRYTPYEAPGDSAADDWSSPEGSSAAEAEEEAAAAAAAEEAAATLAAAKEAAIADLQAAYDAGAIGYDQFVLYSDTVNEWEAGEEVSFENVLSTFQSLQEGTIDPYYAQQIEIATTDLQASQDYLNELRGITTDSEALNREEDIHTAKSNLEASGLTFSGEATRQLGEESAFATDADNPLLAIQALGEGVIPESHSLIASSSQAEYEEDLRELAATAETTLGTETATGLGFESLGTTDPITGSIADEQDTLEAAVLTSLYSEAMGNEAQGNYLNLLST